MPKAAVRYIPAYQHEKYYRHYVLNFLQARELNDPRSTLVRLITNKRTKITRKVVRKMDLEERYPCAKNFLFEFSRDNPTVLLKYRDDLEKLEKTDRPSDVDRDDETPIASALADVLKATPSGDNHASAYHRLMIGIVEFIFYPKLSHPTKEEKIHDGRKRIDIMMENSAHTGLFYFLPTTRQIPCSYVPIECKNYSREVANPELDQLSGRFSVNRGKVGYLCCRQFQDRNLFVKRCQDTFRDNRGLVMPLDDSIVLRYLDLIARGERGLLENEWSSLAREVCLN